MYIQVSEKIGYIYLYTYVCVCITCTHTTISTYKSCFCKFKTYANSTKIINVITCSHIVPNF